MTLIIALVATAWAVYHAGIEEGRRRMRRDNGEPVTPVTKIWERRR